MAAKSTAIKAKFAVPELDHDRWRIVGVDESDVPKAVLKVLTADKLISKIHGSLEDLFIRHGDDGGWCVSCDVKKPAYVWLEMVRNAAELEDNEVFYLQIRTS
jgi:hypothetical protein